MLKGCYEFSSTGLGEGVCRRTACALAFALFQMDCPSPSCSLLEMTTGYQLAFSAPPICGIAVGFILSEWKDGVLVFTFQRNFGFNCQEHPLDFVESQNYRVFQKKCSPYYFQHCFLNARNRGKRLTPHTGWQASLRFPNTTWCEFCSHHVSFVIPGDCSPPGSSVHRILQAKILEWVAMPSSREYSWPRDRTCVSFIGRFFLFFCFFFTTEPVGKPSIQHRSLKWCLQVLF